MSKPELFPFEGDEDEVLYGDFWGLSSKRLEESGRGFPEFHKTVMKKDDRGPHNIYIYISRAFNDF